MTNTDKLRRGFTTQLVRDVNATIKMQWPVYLVSPDVRRRIMQARSQYGKLQVRFTSGKWFSVNANDKVEWSKPK